jgi:ERCC4-type nuclease
MPFLYCEFCKTFSSEFHRHLLFQLIVTVIHTLNLLQVRRLPVGDAIWIAHHKYVDSEYVLDFIVERKNVDDLRFSIRDNRYRDKKLRLLVLILILSIWFWC